MSEYCDFDTQMMILEIEEVFDRIRQMPPDRKDAVFEKIVARIREDFKDVGIFRWVRNKEAEEVPYSELPSSVNDFETVPMINSTDLYVMWNESYCAYEEVHESRRSSVEQLQEQNEQKGNVNSRVEKCHDIKAFSKDYKPHYQCSNCFKRFRVKSRLVKHLKTSCNKIIFVCDICDKSFCSKFILDNHIRVIHEKKKKFNCNDCDYFAYSKHTLWSHVKTKHKTQYEKYACVICEQVFNSRSELKVHLRFHTNDRPYKCDECESRFMTSGHLTNHKKALHGARKYSCEWCGKWFTDMHRLKRHLVVHTKEKPFPCPFCSTYSSNTQGNLTRHVRTVHQMPQYTNLKFKKMMAGNLEEIEEKWLKNSECLTNDYLRTLSSKDGTVHDVDELKIQYLQSKPAGNHLDTVKNTFQTHEIVFQFSDGKELGPFINNNE